MDANPYLAIAASLASGLAGIKEKHQPDNPYKGNASDGDISVARSLHEALGGLQDLDGLTDIIGSEFINAYRLVKLNEFEEFNRVVSSWEREHLL